MKKIIVTESQFLNELTAVADKATSSGDFVSKARDVVNKNPNVDDVSVSMTGNSTGNTYKLNDKIEANELKPGDTGVINKKELEEMRLSNIKKNGRTLSKKDLDEELKRK